jgi:hypothetical protein
MTIDTKGFQPKELTDKELEEMRVDVQDRIIVARVGLLLRHPFFGNMATRMKVNIAMIGVLLPLLMAETYITIHNFLMHFLTKK